MNQPRLLVVDDERSLALTIADYFEARGFRVSVAHELEEAQALVLNDSFDVMLTDLRLTATQHEEGLDLIAFVRHQSPRTFVVLLTAYATEETTQVATQRGACKVLQKPVRLADIERYIRSILNGCEARTTALCEPLPALINDEAFAAALKALFDSLNTVSERSSDSENECALRCASRVLRAIECSDNKALNAKLASCMEGSELATNILRFTGKQKASAPLARELVETISRLQLAGGSSR